MNNPPEEYHIQDILQHIQKIPSGRLLRSAMQQKNRSCFSRESIWAKRVVYCLVCEN